MSTTEKTEYMTLCEDVEELEFRRAADGTIKWNGRSGKQVGDLS